MSVFDHTPIRREVDLAEEWMRRLNEERARTRSAEDRAARDYQWMRAAFAFIEDRGLAADRGGARETVREFYAEKGYGLP